MVERVWADRLTEWIAWNHEEVENALRRVDPDQIAVRPTRSAPSIGFHAWHIGRWVDRHVATLSPVLAPALEPEVWFADGVADRWGLADAELGDFGGTGAGLDDDASAALILPEVDEILVYVTATFRAFERLLGRIDDDAILARTAIDPYGEANAVADTLLNHLSHADRHLGMIEALRGVLGERGNSDGLSRLMPLDAICSPHRLDRGSMRRFAARFPARAGPRP